ncbi:MAG: hypothetical protein H5U19_09180 [Rhodobacteraceae bacterium]|jgi:hypothetical protein|nr:hypothetical protein [Paracoccaceae bacterium]
MKITADISTTSSALRPGREWDPGWMFRFGRQGAWHDPSDLATLFQDVAGTLPVIADGDPVALMRDKSGNGNHARQINAARRPTWRQGGGLSWLEFDGVDDRMESDPVIFAISDFLTCCAGLSYLPGGSGWGALRSRVTNGIYAGLSNPSITGPISNSGGQIYVDGQPAPNDRKALRERLFTPGVLEGRGLLTSAFSTHSWQSFSYWNTSPPGGRLFGYVEYEGDAGPDIERLRRWMAQNTGSAL